VRRLLISSMNPPSSRCTSESATHFQTAPFSSLPAAYMRSEDNMTDLFTDGSSEYPAAGSKHHNGRKRSCSHRRRLSTRTMDSTNTSSNAASFTASSDETLEEFCSRPWIKESINNPWHPNSALSFFTVSHVSANPLTKFVRKRLKFPAIYLNNAYRYRIFLLFFWCHELTKLILM
jgi:hypothetical protein